MFMNYKVQFKQYVYYILSYIPVKSTNFKINWEIDGLFRVLRRIGNIPAM